jgi:hypothetical protein
MPSCARSWHSRALGGQRVPGLLHGDPGSFEALATRPPAPAGDAH